MTFIGAGTLGPGSASRFAARTPGRMGNSPAYGVNYPHPFFDLAHTYLPSTVKQLFQWCRYSFLTNPLINATVFKLSEYPITDIIIDHPSRAVVKLWTDFFHEKLNFRGFQVEAGLDYHCYGNTIMSMAFPFKKYLKCPNCSYREQANLIRHRWRFTNLNFRMECPECGHIGDAIPKDIYFRNAEGIKILRWNCEDVEVTYNDYTGDYTYYYTIPQRIRSDISMGKKDVVEQIPQVFIQALKEKKGVVFSKDNLFHMRRPTLANQDRGWGIPLLLPVLKDTYYLQLMKKANEAILLEHIVPLRVLFPQAGSATSDPYTQINLREWKEQVASEIARWRLDNNYIPIMPLPLGQESIGGDGRALLMTPELKQIAEDLMMGMGVPREFLIGGMSYAGTNVSMRMVENQFIAYILRQKQMAMFIMNMIADFMEWPKVNIRFKPFKMADDIQRKAFLFQLNQAGKISDTTLLADVDLDAQEENDIMRRETDDRIEAMRKQQIAQAEIQGEQQEIMMKYQMKAQQAAAATQGGPMQEMQSQLNSGQQGGGISMEQMAAGYAQQLAEMPEDQRGQALQAIQAQSPELYQLVYQYLQHQQKQVGGGSGPTDGVDMRPQPEQLPARREGASV